MKTELQKCLDGEEFISNSPEIMVLIKNARRLTRMYNNSDYDDSEKRESILRDLLGGIGDNVTIDNPFYCDYGKNIFIGNNVFININCTFVDCNRIEIGDNVLIASNVQMYTSTHPTEVKERIVADWTPAMSRPYYRTYARPIKIGDNAWIGGGVIILPGVTIGENSVVGAGSIVNRSIPDNCVAAGNPCRIIRRLQEGQTYDKSDGSGR